MISGSNSNITINHCYSVHNSKFVNSGSSSISNSYQDSGTWSVTNANSVLQNSLSPYSNIWSDINFASPPVLNSPFLLTVFTQAPFYITSYNQVNTACLDGLSEILMGDGTTKLLKDIERGDIVMEDIVTKKTNMVARLYKSLSSVICCVIPKGLIGNTDDLIISGGHPIFCNDGKNRIRARDIRKIKRKSVETIVYNIQFEDDGSFYANGIKIDSFPPYNNTSKLPLDLYFDKSKYKCYTYESEDDPIRNKPPMTQKAYNFN